MERKPYPHPSLNVEKQVALLQAKGLLVADTAIAKQWLSHIGYFRLKNYSFSLKDHKNAKGNYIPNTRFQDVQDIYAFDRKLRMIVFDAIESIEISVKAHISNIMSNTYGPHWYLDTNHFSSETAIPRNFNHQKLLREIKKRLAHTSEPLLRYYKRAFAPIYPPSWMLMEIITFGTLSLMFRNLKSSKEKTEICKSFNLPRKHLTSWLHSFSSIRNRCAHHSKLVYSAINFAPALPTKERHKFLAEANSINNASLYAVLCCIQYMLNICNIHSRFSQNLLSLAEEFPAIDFKRLGFTPNWKNEKIWTS